AERTGASRPADVPSMETGAAGRAQGGGSRGGGAGGRAGAHAPPSAETATKIHVLRARFVVGMDLTICCRLSTVDCRLSSHPSSRVLDQLLDVGGLAGGGAGEAIHPGGSDQDHVLDPHPDVPPL